MPTAIIVDDCTLTRCSLESVCEEEGFDVVASVDSVGRACEAYLELNPDLVLLDVEMKNRETGLEVAALIRRIERERTDGGRVKIVLCTAHEKEAILRMVDYFQLDGFISKSCDRDKACRVLRLVRTGGSAWTTEASPFSLAEWETRLSESQLRALLMYGLFKTDQEGAETLGMSVETFRKHRHAVEDRLKLRDLKLSEFCHQKGLPLLPPDAFGLN